MEGTMALSATSRAVRPSYESDSIRLQKDAENFTQKYQQERRMSLLLDDSIREMAKKYEQKQALLKQINLQKQVNARYYDQIAFLEVKVNRAKLELGDLLVHNRRLRTEIDSVRKGTVDGLSATRRLEGELAEIKEDATEARKRGSRSVAYETKTRHRIIVLHESKAETQANISQRISSLQNEILEDRRVKKELLKRLLNTPVTAELSESGLVTKHLYEKWVILCREKRHEVDAYRRRIEDFTGGFEKMMEFSSIDSLAKVVVSFLNSLERQKEIQKHLVILSENFDEIAEELAAAKAVIAQVSSSEASHSVLFQELETSLTQKIDAVRTTAEAKTACFTLLTREVEILQGPLLELYQLAAGFRLSPNFSEPVELTESSEFNFTTAGVFLVQLEELTDQLIALVQAEQRKDARTPGFTFIAKKDFNRTLDMGMMLDPENQPRLEEEVYPISPPDFHKRVRKALNRTTLL